jgi:hypothetical protein
MARPHNPRGPIPEPLRTRLAQRAAQMRKAGKRDPEITEALGISMPTLRNMIGAKKSRRQRELERQGRKWSTTR